ncbi:MAG: HNH endonuclease signature motif containing protein [Candidatus Cybelea sp.]
MPGGTARFGHFALRGKSGVRDRINWSNRTNGNDLILGKQEYTFPCGAADVQLSLQLYFNVRRHYRLFAYTRAGDVEGMTFSVNLTTKRESRSVIFLEQPISFKERYPDARDGGIERRRQKQILLCDVLRRIGMDVDDDARLVLGVFDPQGRMLLDATPESFLNNFVAAALLKGHFQGNKGYELDVIPSMRAAYDLFAPAKMNPKWKSLRGRRPAGRPPIPLAVRYKVLARDRSVCRRCGRGVAGGLTLHIDHKTPVSLGGDSGLKNLWTLCSECNLGKGNRIIDR